MAKPNLTEMACALAEPRIQRHGLANRRALPTLAKTIWPTPSLANTFFSSESRVGGPEWLWLWLWLVLVLVWLLLVWTLRTPPRRTAQNFALFSLSRTHFVLFLSLGVFSWNFGGV